MNRDPLCTKVNDWFDRWYGDRAKITMGTGTMGVILRGDVLRMEFPIGYGLNRIACSRDLTKEAIEAQYATLQVCEHIAGEL